MQEVIIAIVIGIFLGWFDILSYKTKFYMNKLSTCCLFIMLICLSAKIGCDKELLAQIEVLGIQSFVLGLFTIIGSMLALYPVAYFYRKKNKVQGENEHDI